MKNVLSAAVSTVTMKLTILLMVSFFILLFVFESREAEVIRRA